MKRRVLLQQLALAGAASSFNSSCSTTPESDRLGPILPKRPLGSSGEAVTCLGLGGFHIGWVKEDTQARVVIDQAIESGIRFFDTAESYGKGRSEERYGRYLVPQYRDDVFLMTKTQARDSAAARNHLEGSLKRLKTDRIDLWQVHALSSPQDAENRLSEGILEVALRAQEEGKIRHIGFTGHASPYAHLRMMKDEAVRKACVSCQFPINPVDAASRHSFVEQVIPEAQACDIGILAMKTLADGRFFARKEMNGSVKWTTGTPVIPDVLTIEDCIGFALSMPISVLITGAEKPEYVVEKAAMVRRFAALKPKGRLQLVNRVAAFAEAGDVEYYKDRTLRKAES